ncbi:MAG: 50S ribosomal protein L3 [Elusimicrobiota bacterium]
MSELLGTKLGMTRVYDKEGIIRPVTLLRVGPCYVTDVRTVEKNGYNALQIGFGEVTKRKSTKPYIEHFKKLNLKPLRWLKEIRLNKTDGIHLGQEFKVDLFSEGELVDVTATSKGKGFAGVVKRHNFAGGSRTHGQSDRQRAPGASGSQRPQRVKKGTRMPGHMGDITVTVQHLMIEKVLPEDNLLVIRGSVPGNSGELLSVRKTTRKIKAKLLVEAERHKPKGKGKAPKEVEQKKKK